MTKKINKDVHRKIIDKNAPPDSEETRKDMEEAIYGDDNNPHEKFHAGDDITDYLETNEYSE